jgi:hypothetical protein
LKNFGNGRHRLSKGPVVGLMAFVRSLSRKGANERESAAVGYAVGKQPAGLATSHLERAERGDKAIEIVCVCEDYGSRAADARKSFGLHARRSRVTLNELDSCIAHFLRHFARQKQLELSTRL